MQLQRWCVAWRRSFTAPLDTNVNAKEMYPSNSEIELIKLGQNWITYLVEDKLKNTYLNWINWTHAYMT